MTATENRTGHPARTASIAVVIVVLLALVVFPGFLAAGLSRGKSPAVILMPWITAKTTPAEAIIPGAWVYVGDRFICGGPLVSVLRLIFAPAEKLSRVSYMMREFYLWQYELAGGTPMGITIR